MKKSYLCPVCGYQLKYAPSDFNICPSCGTEFGYADSGRTYEELRTNWLLHGAKWTSAVEKQPGGWDAFSQLANLNAIPTYSNRGFTPIKPVTVHWTNVDYQTRT